MHSYYFFPLLLLLSSCAVGQKENSSGISNTKSIWVEIELNALEDQPFGIPIQSGVQSLFFQITTGQEILEKVDKGQFLTFSLSGDTLSMQCSGEPYTGSGNFILLPIPEMKYRAIFDPATFDPIISPFYYYSPARIGRWVLQTKNSTLDKKYKVKFISNAEGFNNRK